MLLFVIYCNAILYDPFLVDSAVAVSGHVFLNYVRR